MPRIRTIKPELWESPDVYDRDDAFQALWVWLISQADDAGRLHMDASHIAQRRRRSARITERSLAQMEERGMIVRYQIDGGPYLAIVNWSLHQRVDKPSKAVYPAPPDGISTSPRGAFDESSRGFQEDSKRTRASRAPRPDPTGGRGPDRTGTEHYPVTPPSGDPAKKLASTDAATNGTPRSRGTNPRATGTNPRAQGTNPRAQRSSPRPETPGPVRIGDTLAELGRRHMARVRGEEGA